MISLLHVTYSNEFGSEQRSAGICNKSQLSIKQHRHSTTSKSHDDGLAISFALIDHSMTASRVSQRNMGIKGPLDIGHI